MYKLVIGMKNEGEYETFPEAFGALYEKVHEMGKNGIVLQWLSMIWIEGDLDGLISPLMFEDAVALAHNIGLLSEENKLQEITVGLSEEALITAAKISAAMAVIIRQEEVDIIGEKTRIDEETIKRYGWQ